MRDLKIYLGMATLLLIGYIAFEYNKPQPVNWQPTLYYGDKIPFGTYIFYHRLNDIFPGTEVINTNSSIYSFFIKPHIPPSNYIIISQAVTVSKTDFKAMANYISVGNSILISALQWKGFLSDTLKLETGSSFTQSKTTLSFTNKNLYQGNKYLFDKGTAGNYFSKFDTAKAVVISKNQDGKSTFLSFQIGKGKLYVCANPLVFSNYSLLNSQDADYAAKAISYLPAANTTFWDEYQNHDIAEDRSPMRVFFKYPALQWAYYISLFSLIVFVLFEVKRRQRIIPVIEPLKNSSLNFVKVVGGVYYEQRDNTNITLKKITFLLAHLRDKYQLKTNKLDKEFIDTLIKKTGIEPIFANELVDFVNYVGQQNRVNDHELILLNQFIEKFYIQSK